MRAHTKPARLVRLTSARPRATVAPVNRICSPAAILALVLAACPAPDDGGAPSSTSGESSTGPDANSSSATGPSSSSTGGDEPSTGAVETTGEVSGSSSGTSSEAESSSGSSTGAVDLCGDGQVGPGETCDLGAETKICDDDCTLPMCGDLHVNAAAGEECDDGNVDEEDGCLSDCKLPVCGDGKVQVGEACDDGNEFDGDGCDNDCLVTLYTWTGVKANVAVDALVGWDLCFEYPGIPDMTSLNSVFAKCKQSLLLFACGSQNKPATYILAAQAMRVDLLKSADAANPNILNDTQWANDFTHYGFSTVGIDMTDQSSYMFMWTMKDGFIKAARCGSSPTEMRFVVYGH